MSVPPRAVQLNEANAFLKEHPEVLYVDLLIADMNGVVRGKRIERLISMTNFAQQDSLMRVQRVMEASGINTALRAAGVQEGDLVYIEKAALNWSDEE